MIRVLFAFCTLLLAIFQFTEVLAEDKLAFKPEPWQYDGSISGNLSNISFKKLVCG